MNQAGDGAEQAHAVQEGRFVNFELRRVVAIDGKLLTSFKHQIS